ncbi:efflux RND transporter periplasmic adaptor subunit [Puia sp. P3]|uniref:efflux RND transporter periplasmic adaptor subunit n=1 Tax=Puia sp. P3 TaxID=3423952 RepID=UPI003D66E963
MDGVVSLLSIKKGERVVGNSMMAGTEMMRVADMSRIETIVDVGENDIPKVHLGDSALITVDAYNTRKFRGLVTQIASSVTTCGRDFHNDGLHQRRHQLQSAYPAVSRQLQGPDRPGPPKELPLPPGYERQRGHPDANPRKRTVGADQCRRR